MSADRLSECEQALRGCVEALESVAPMTPHVRGCDEPDDPCCVRCVIDSEIARAREALAEIESVES